ncbi:penicillin acylase family protein [Rhodobacteraceae bacterium NNCM2]|nr:penicillin acylase family protein [Coraliihabitans acroporae]
MAMVLRLLLRLVIGLLVALLVAAGVAWYLIGGSLPDYEGEVRLKGLEAPARVTRDANAVPHIRAESTHDAWFALGAMHAQDRMWQMELARRAAQGRLSTYFGARTVPLDRLVKTLDIYGRASKSLRHQTPETQAALEAYADGVNAWIRHVNEDALGRGAPEFFVYSDGITPWVPADSLAILKMLALNLSGAARREIRRGQFQLVLDAERVADILPDYPSDATTTAPRFSALFPGAEFARFTPPEPDLSHIPWMPAQRPEFAGASNAWAVDGTRTSSGKPLLASDPHLWLQAPSVWYMADLKGGEISAIGGTIPGIPAVLIGHNGKVGWGLTTTGVDDQDVYIEEVNAENPAEYRTPSGWRPFENRAIRIEVADGVTLSETVRATRHGPVLSGAQFGADKVTPKGHVAALRWTGLTEEDTSMSGLHKLMQAEVLRDVVDAAAYAVAPAQNVIMADETSVGMITSGAIPERSPLSRSQGRIPSPGWVAENDWQGIRPARLNPRVMRPLEGAVANANNRITDDPFPDNVTFDWGYPYRVQRLIKELSGRAFHSRDSFVALQNDTVSEMARSVLPLIAREMWWGDSADREPVKAAALEALRNWTGEMNQHAPEPLIFSEWMRALTRRLALDELGTLFASIDGPRPLFVERVYRDIDGASIWCDIDKTPQQETCAEIAELALDDALANLREQYGDNLEAWRWGRVHRAIHKHQPFGLAGPFGLFLNIDQETSGGNFTLMRGLSAGRGPTPYENIHAAGLRVVYDFADLNRSVWMIGTGQSGHPFSRWYDHLSDMWARGDVIPMSMSDEENRAGAVGVMELLPAAP